MKSATTKISFFYFLLHATKNKRSSISIFILLGAFLWGCGDPAEKENTASASLDKSVEKLYRHQKKTSYGKNLTPLQRALFLSAEEGNRTKVRQLLSGVSGEKVDVNTQDEYGDSVIFSALLYGDPIMFTDILAHKPKIELVNTFGQHALHLAVQGSHFDSTQRLLKYAAEYFKNNFQDNKQFLSWLNQQDSLGNSALHLAVVESDLAVVKELLRLGADKSLQNKEKKTAVQLAQGHHQKSMVALLR